MKKIFLLILIISNIFLAGCPPKNKYPITKNNMNSDDECIIENPDPYGYLLKICNYIKENGIDVSPADPTKYKVQKVENVKYYKNGKDSEPIDAVFVKLDCCYIGDVAYFDKETGEIIKFKAGAI
jgi:hypothetical protein